MGQFTDMTNGLAVFLRIVDREGEASAFQFAFIAHLATGFCVERRLIQNDNRFLACRYAINGFAVDEQGGHFRVQFRGHSL